MKKLFGVNVPIISPMNEDGSIDYGSLENLCSFLIENGVDGLYPCGSNGEMAFLTVDERKKILETTLKISKGKVNVFSMVGTNSFDETIELARHAEKQGADGIGIVTPYYFKLDDEELENYFVRIAASVSKDFSVYLYGIPQLAVNDITPALAQRITEKAPNVIGIKYSYPNMVRLIDFLDIGNDFSVIAGPDRLFLSFIASGGDGVISGNANVIPGRFAEIWKLYKQGDLEAAQKAQLETNKLLSILCASHDMVNFKVVLRHMGIIKSDMVRFPLRVLRPEEKSKLIKEVEALNYKNSF
jgi:4-hydroxy-tetrahydrodipicolinate synthase